MNNTKPKRGRPIKPITENKENQYLSVQELSDMLKLSQSHIYTLTSTKKIPYIKLLNKKLLFDRNEIENWLRSKKVSAII